MYRAAQDPSRIRRYILMCEHLLTHLDRTHMWFRRVFAGLGAIEDALRYRRASGKVSARIKGRLVSIPDGLALVARRRGQAADRLADIQRRQDLLHAHKEELQDLLRTVP